MDQAKLDLITASIKGTVDRLAGMAESIPGISAYTPAIAIGQAIIDAVPEVADVINSWVSGAQPTDAERAAVAKQIHDLITDPENV
jgi:hypothetical protein